jgi:hypothetical protein
MKFRFAYLPVALFLWAVASSGSDTKADLSKFSPKDVTESSIKLSNGITINFKHGFAFSQGHSRSILQASWSLPGKTNCCSQELFNAATDGSDKIVTQFGDRIGWRVFTNEPHGTGLTRTKRDAYCWELNKDKSSLQATNTCLKPHDNRFPQAKE